MNFTIPATGNASIVSQSGTLATLITLAASDRGIGFNKYVSSGNEVDLHLEDFLEYYACDLETKIVAAFIEGVREGEKFIRASKEITKSKPFIVLKGGATKAGAGAASSHTGALAGSDTVFDALCKQSGITRVSNNREMVNLLQAFSTLPLPKGRKVAIVSAQGGLGVLAADACVKCGLELASLTRETRDNLDAFLPYFWSHKNPVDATGGIADFTILSQALEVLLRQEDIQSIICLAPIFSVIFSTIRPRLSNVVQDAFKSTLVGVLGEMEEKVANDFIGLRKKYGKPIVSVGLFAQRGSEGVRLLEEGGIPVHDTPDEAAYVISRLAEYKEYLEGLGETP
jgi:acyl-CoA synthetase (NDP forming)